MPNLIPVDEFIKKHLTQNCVSMVGHIHINQLLPEISKYFENENAHPSKSMLTLRVKLLDYYSCMRNFDVCDFILAGIINQLKYNGFELDSAFENQGIEAQYLIARAYQYRNYEPVQNFELSEASFLESEKIILKFLDKESITETDRQAYIDLLFNSMISRFWLYANYMNNQNKANKLMNEIDDRLSTTKVSVSAYLVAYYFFAGCYYLKNEDYESSINALKKTYEQECTDETRWFFEQLKSSIKDKLDEAEKKSSLVDRNKTARFFTDRENISVPDASHTSDYKNAI